MHHLRLAVLLLALAGPATAQVQPVELQSFLPPSSTTVPGNFGNAIDAQGDLLIVGDQENGFPRGDGRAFVYTRIPGGWNAPIELQPVGAGLLAAFGFAVATDGIQVFVSAPQQTGPNGEGGVVYQYELVNGNLVPGPLLTASDDAGGVLGSSLGVSLELDGDVLVVGAAGFTGQTRSVYVFERGPQGFVETEKLLSPTPAMGDFFGFPLSLAGDRLAVGAPGIPNTSQSITTGEVFVFQRTTNGWVLEDSPLASGLGLGDNFGASVALLGDRLIVGAPQRASGGDGRTFAFLRTGSDWVQSAELIQAMPATAAEFGSAVALANNFAVVTAISSPFQVDIGGAAVVFERSGEEWFETNLFAPANLEFGDLFGLAPVINEGPQGLEFFSGAAFGGASGPSPSGSFFAFSLENTSLGQRLCAGSPANACPCGNAGSDTAGCAHASNSGGRLGAEGSLSIALDDLTLEASDLAPSQLALPFVSPTSQSPDPVGDGLLCIGSPALRLDLAQSDAMGRVSFGPNLASQVGWLAGQTWTVQVAFRDPGASPCSTFFNYTGALGLTFQP